MNQKAAKSIIANAILKSAQEHGSADDPEHEVGDLQDVVLELFDKFVTDDQACSLIKEGSGFVSELISDHYDSDLLAQELSETRE